MQRITGPGGPARRATRVCVVAAVLVLLMAADVVERWPWQAADRDGYRSEPGGFGPP